MREEIINMTQKEINRLRVINQTIDKVITIREAAELLCLSERQVIRLKGGVKKEGPAFIIHKNRGRKPKHAILDKTKTEIIKLKQSKYKEANFAHFQELLGEHEDIHVSYPTVYRILSMEGIKSPKKHRKSVSHHRRKRMPQKGMLVQIDASPHEWIFGGEPFSLHGAIDDATGEILALFFAPNECMEGYFQVMRRLIDNYGLPTSIYCDRHTIFVSPLNDKLTIEDQLQGKTFKLTQFGRAMNELGINIIKARSPQAKGRVEKLWNTLQSRLPVEFKIRGIDTMEDANAFLMTFMRDYNQKFGVVPENPESAFRTLDPGINLDLILCIKVDRKVIDGSAFSYQGCYYQLVKNNKIANAIPKANLKVLIGPKIGVKAIYANVVYDTIVLKERPKKASLRNQENQLNKQSLTKSKPALDHPWRDITKKKATFSYEETDSEILDMLNDLFGSTRAWA